MAPLLRVLLVEDTAENIELWNDAVQAHNADSNTHGFSINSENAKSVEEASGLLDSRKFDAAVVDLRLHSPSDPVGPNDDGNLLVKKILDTQPIGVVVYTGQKAEATDYGCPQVSVVDRGDGLQPIFTWLKEHTQLFVNLRSVRDAFDAETAKLFFKSIWPRWSHWTTVGDSAALKQVVARHVIAHAHDSMLHGGGDSVHPEETYFVPPLKPRLDTGDLLDLDGAVWIVVTPRCDMARDGKVSTVLLARCQDISAEWTGLVDAGTNKAKEELKKLVQHGNAAKQHFLPKMRDHRGTRGPWMVQFHDLKASDAKSAFADMTAHRFASLTPQFTPSLVERFGAYFSRIGTPDLSSN